MDTRIPPVVQADGSSINELITGADGLVEQGRSMLVDHGAATTMCLVAGGLALAVIKTIRKTMVARAKKGDKDPLAEGLGAVFKAFAEGLGAVFKAMAKNIDRRGQAKAEMAVRELERLYADDDDHERRMNQEVDQRRGLRTVRTPDEAERGQPPPAKSEPTDDATVTSIKGRPARPRRTRNSRRPRRRTDPPQRPGPATESGKQ